MAKILHSVGSVLRQAGRAVNSLGASMQGRYAYKETRAPAYTRQAVYIGASMLWHPPAVAGSGHSARHKAH
jgi:hypothetical protein